MMFRKIRSTACIAFLCAGFLFPSEHTFAQAPPGPMNPTQPLPPPKPAPPAKKKPVIPARKTLAGYWKLNLDESDDAKTRLDEARRTKARGGNDPNDPNGPGGPGGSGNPGGGNGRVGVGFPPIPGGGGGNGPYGGSGRGMGGGDSELSQKIFEQIRPDISQSISLMDTEVDSLNDHGDKRVFFTDGRKIQKSKNEAVQEIPAHWDGQKLVTDEKGPQGKKLSRTIELSPDGRQFYETWHVENGKSGSPISIRYVYDAADEYAQ
jgi:hypothetical protein